jgi:hypothetical protein
LTGDAGKEKTGLDGRFFYVWGLCFKAEINVLAQNRCFVSVFLALVTVFSAPFALYEQINAEIVE